LADEVKAICESGCDLVHVDVMDGHFVPNLTIGPVVVSAVAQVATQPLDIHLMVQNNTFFVELFAPLKPEYISFHIEEEKHPHRLIQKIRSLGIKPAIALNPHTPPQAVEFLLKDLDMVLLMSVNPGFGGQKFIPSVIDKAERLKRLIKIHNPSCLIEVDGGVNDRNVSELKGAGVDIVVAGSFVFGHKDGYQEAIESLKK
jgi:ribulose-phosphate 3-epimerase